MKFLYPFKILSIIYCVFITGFSFTSSQNAITYSKVDAIFQNKCANCHGHMFRTSGLSLESFETLMNGGKRGPAVVPGKSGDSLLVRFLEGTMQPQMPPGYQISAAELATIKAWIDAGAKGPGKAAMSAPATITTETSGKTSVPAIRPAAPVRAAITALAFQSDDGWLALGSYQKVELLHQTRYSSGTISELSDQIRGLAFSLDGKLLAAASGKPGQFGEITIMRFTDFMFEKLHSIRGHRDNIFSIAFGPDGRTLATCSYDRMIKLWDAATGKELRNLKDHTDAVFSIAFSPDGKLLASASADRTVKVWNIATGERLYTLGDGLDAMNTVAFHPSGKMLAGAGADRVIRLWEVSEKEGRQLRSLIAHEEAINQIIFSPDGKTLISTGADKTIKLWNAATLDEIKMLEHQPDWVFTMAYTPDGKSLAVGRYDGSVVMYDLKSEKGVALK
jgi:hypothetical protein